MWLLDYQIQYKLNSVYPPRESQNSKHNRVMNINDFILYVLR